MKHNVDKNKFAIYEDIVTKHHIAIKQKNVKIIEKANKKYRNSDKIPDDKVVPGIRLQNISNDEVRLISENEIEFDILIKNLRFSSKGLSNT